MLCTQTKEEEEAYTFALLRQAEDTCVFLPKILASSVSACSKAQAKRSIGRSKAQAPMPERCLCCQLSWTQLLLKHRNAAPSALHMQNRQEAIKKATAGIGTGGRKDKKRRTKENLTFSIFCSQPLQVLLLDFAYSAAKSFRLFSALPPPSWSPPFPGEQRETQSSASNVILPHFYKKSPLCQIVSSLH